MIPIILSGGVGSRLWPVSREKLPKQFAQIFTDSLFSSTMARFDESKELIVVTNKDHGVHTFRATKNRSDAKIFLEPRGRNTAPAVALACRYLQIQGKENQVCGVFPSDQWIDNEKAFKECLALAAECAELGNIVTISIQPSFPATGFGYIEADTNVVLEKQGLKAKVAKAFKEKPNQATAQAYIDSGNYSWNSGMFVFTPTTMIAAFERHMPKMWKYFSDSNLTSEEIDEIFSSIDSQSLDYGIMEHVDNHVTIPGDIGWSDLGSWDDIAKFSSKIKNQASTTEVDAKNNFSYSMTNKHIALVGVSDLHIIETEDALLVAKQGKSQEVKKVVESLKAIPALVRDHVFEYRPWGMYRNLYEEKDFKTKVITVDPGQQLSYQSHDRRAETWIIVAGKGEVVIDDVTKPVERGTVVTIPLKSKHRMRNNGTKPLKFVEVQFGDYFGEDDIVRYSDDYGRKGTKT